MEEISNGTNRQRQAANTRRKIFECAQELFSRTPYENIKIEDICKAANVSVGAFYHYFANKEEILEEGSRQFGTYLKHMYETRIQPTPRDTLFFLNWCRIHPLDKLGPFGTSYYFRYQLSGTYAEKMDKYQFYQSALLETVTKEVQAGTLIGDPAEISDEISHLVRGVIYEWCIRNGSFDLWTHTKSLIEKLLFYYETRHD